VSWLAVIAALAAEALWASAIAQWIGAGYRPDQQIVPWPGFLAVAALGFFAASLLSHVDLSRRAWLGAAAMASYVVLYGTLRFIFAGDLALWDFGWVAMFLRDADAAAERGADAFIAALLLVPLWARAAARGSSDVDLESFGRSTLPVMVGAPLTAALGAASSRADAIAATAFAAVAVGVLALTFAQLARSGATFGDLRAGSFAAVLLALVIGSVGAAVVLFGVVYTAAASTIGHAVLDGAVVVLTWLLTPVAWTIERLLNLFRSGEAPLQPPREIARGILGTGEQASESQGAWGWLAYVGRASILMLLLAFFAAVATAAFRFWGHRARPVGVGPEVAGSGSLAEDLMGALRRLVGRSEGSLRARRLHPVAALYLRVLAAGARRGVVRAPGNTPEELREPLRAAVGDPVTDRITDALEAFRYAGRPPDADAVRRLDEEWRVVERRG
jgi:hypothetical protein